jgi:transcriptional regulator with XRE-family HTH domain
MASTGEYICDLRAERGLTLVQLGEQLGVSANYLSELERGLKMPSDLFVRKLSDFFGINEDIIFKRLGKIPLAAREELESSLHLQETLAEINRSRMSEDTKQKMYDEISKIYIKYLHKTGEEGDTT